MNYINYEGIILKSINYKDTSKIIYLVTKTGIKSVLIKGVRNYKNQFRLLSQIYQEVSIITTDKDLSLLIDGDIINDFNFIKDDFNKLNIINKISKISYYYLEQSLNYFKFYDLIKKTFYAINNNINEELVYLVFKIKLLYFIGFQPQLTKCVICENERMIGFNYDLGGMVCNNHINTNTLSKNLTKVFLDLVLIKFDDLKEYHINNDDLHNLVLCIEQYYDLHIN